MFKPKTATSLADYFAQIDEPRKEEMKKLHKLIREAAPDLKPYIVHNIIGYGKRPHKTKGGQEGDWFALGLASQKQYISIYSCECYPDGSGYVAERYKEELKPASVGRSCIRYRHFDDIDPKVLKKVIKKPSNSRKVIGSQNQHSKLAIAYPYPTATNR